MSLLDRRKSYLCKLATQLVLNPSSLWAQLIKAKYQFDGQWHLYTKPRNTSAIWARICSVVSTIQHQFIWQISDGQSINILDDPWAAPMPFNAWPTFINVDSPLAQLSVSDLVMPTKQ